MLPTLFQLTNDNYGDLVTVLKERFGQTHTQVNTHMQALIDTPTPSNALSSLREFYDSTQVA